MWGAVGLVWLYLFGPTHLSQWGYTSQYSSTAPPPEYTAMKLFFVALNVHTRNTQSNNKVDTITWGKKGRTKNESPSLHTYDGQTAFREVMQFMSWQFPPKECVEQWWNPHTCLHTIFNTFRKPLMNDILWGTVSVRPTRPLQILTASIHKRTWTVKMKSSLGIKKKPVAYLPAGTMASPIWHTSCPEWETTKAC